MAGKGETVVDVEIIEDEDELDPTDLRALFFRPLKLTPEKLVEVEADLKELVKDAYDTRADLDNLLIHWNDLAEGIAPPKNFPWMNSSNIHVPVAETKLNEYHSAARQTSLRSDQVYYVRSVGDPLDPQQVAKLEQYLNYKVTTQLSLVGKLSELAWAAGRDGTVIAHVYYDEEYKTLPVVKTYRGVQEFVAAYPEVKGSGLSKTQYQKVLEKFAKGAPTVRLLEEVDKCTYRGPKVDVVELQDFLMSPMTAIRTEYARLVGKVFTLRAPEIKARAEHENWSDEAVTRVTTSNDPGRNDAATSLKDQIEGIARMHADKNKSGEFVIFNGIYRADLDGDGKEEKYLVFFHYQSGTLLGGVHFPYVHGEDNFIAVRVKKRPNRFLGRGFCQMLDDINIETNTQHNQRIDSRTITTVPTFKAKNTERQNFDPSRPDSRFFPGKVFYLTDLNAVQQFDMKQTDMSETLQEENALMSLVDRQVGTMSPQNVDPRAAMGKTRMLLSMTDARMDDYLEELAGNGERNEGFDAIGEQIFALLHQFIEDDEIIPLAKGGALAAPGPMAPAPQIPGAMAPAAPAAPGQGGAVSAPPPGAMPGMPGAPGAMPGLPGMPGAAPAQAQALPGAAPMIAQPQPVTPPVYKATITAEDLEAAQGRVQIGLAKVSTAMNPDNALMRFNQIYSLLVMDPLVGGTPKGRLALDRKLLELARIDNAEAYLPPDPQTAEQWMAMQQSIIASMEARKGGRPGARTRGAGKEPSAGGMAAGQGGGPKV